MEKQNKLHYHAPQLSLTAFMAEDILMKSSEKDENQGPWQPLTVNRELPVDNLEIQNIGDIQ